MPETSHPAARWGSVPNPRNPIFRNESGAKRAKIGTGRREDLTAGTAGVEGVEGLCGLRSMNRTGGLGLRSQ